MINKTRFARAQEEREDRWLGALLPQVGARLGNRASPLEAGAPCRAQAPRRTTCPPRIGVQRCGVRVCARAEPRAGLIPPSEGHFVFSPDVARSRHPLTAQAQNEQAEARHDDVGALVVLIARCCFSVRVGLWRCARRRQASLYCAQNAPRRVRRCRCAVVGASRAAAAAPRLDNDRKALRKLVYCS